MKSVLKTIKKKIPVKVCLVSSGVLARSERCQRRGLVPGVRRWGCAGPGAAMGTEERNVKPSLSGEHGSPEGDKDL